MRFRHLVAATAFGLALMPVAGAHAQGAAPATQDAGADALALAREGVALYEAGKWAEAEAKFVAAEAKLHSPVFVLYIARTRRSQGRWIDARDTLRKLKTETLPDDAPPPWKQALVDARAELAALEPTIPSIVVSQISVHSGASLSVNGKPATAGVAIELDPGTYEVVVQGSGRRDVTTVELRGGERERPVDVVRRGASPPPDNLVPPSRAGTPRPASTSTQGSWVPGAVVMGVGVAGLGIGAITGILALGASDDVQAACDEGVCPAGAKTDVDSDRSRAGTMADVSTVSFIAGGVVTAAGFVLLVTRPFGGEDVAVQASPGAVRLIGKF